MDVLFIYSLQEYYTSSKPIFTQRGIHHGIAYISGLLKRHGYNTDVLVLTRKTKTQLIDNTITQFRPQIIGFTAVTTEYYFISRTAQYIKNKFPSCFLILGGVFATLNPERAIKGPFDAICVGEGEYPMLELVNQLKAGDLPSNIHNIWVKAGNKIERNTTRPFIQDLDILPFLDREIFQKWIHSVNEQPGVFIGRGCPYNCSYCSNHALRKQSPGKFVRFRSISGIISEIEAVIDQLPEVKDIFLMAETIGVFPDYDLDLCSALEEFNEKRPNPVFFVVNLRIIPNINLEPLFQAFQRARINTVSIGLESGSEKVRKRILRRNYSNRDFFRTVRLAKKYGINVITLNMIGLPGESEEDFKQTIAVNKACLPWKSQLFIFFPYPGTDLYRTCKEMGILPKRIDSRLERTTSNLDSDSFSKKQIQEEFQWFFYNIYRGYKPLSWLIGSVVGQKLKSNNISNSILQKIIQIIH